MPKYRCTIIDEDSDDQTQSKILGEDTFVHDDDTVHTSEVPPKNF